MIVEKELVGNAEVHDLFSFAFCFCSHFTIFMSIAFLVVLGNNIRDSSILLHPEIVFD